MKSTRSILLALSATVVIFVIGGGLALQVGASDNSYKQVVVFSEILSLVLENYVDPVESEKLMGGAYEGMLGGLDANGAFLTPEEVAEWKAGIGRATAQPGLAVLKAGHSLQVVAVDPASPAEEAGIEIGDQIRAVDGRSVRDLSLSQAWRLLRGKPGSRAKLDVLHPGDGFRREEIEVQRESGFGTPYDVRVDRGTAILRIRDMARVPVEAVAEELAEIRTGGVERLLLDLRNVTDLEPREVSGPAGLFGSGPLLRLRNRSGDLLETLEGPARPSAWAGAVAVLVNGATAGSAEALASFVQGDLGGLVLGESTYGLGAEAKLYELNNGSGLLVSSALWETRSGKRWNGDGVQPDQIIHGNGNDYAQISADQLSRALDFLSRPKQEGEAPKPAV